MERVLILTADSGEELEVYYMLYRLREAGYAVDVAAPARKTLQLVVHDFEPGWDTYVERKGYLVEADLSFDDVNTNDYHAVLFPGGRAPEYLRNDHTVLEIVREFARSGKFVFSICHGIQILVEAGLAAASVPAP